jgi:hypothetical protein
MDLDIGSDRQFAISHHLDYLLGSLDGGLIARISELLLGQTSDQPKSKADHQALQGAVGGA